jgi:hypothetical protein
MGKCLNSYRAANGLLNVCRNSVFLSEEIRNILFLCKIIWSDISLITNMAHSGLFTILYETVSFE